MATKTSSMNLMMLGESETFLASSNTLFINGVGNNGNYRIIPLYINSILGIDNVLSSSFNLFLPNTDHGFTTSSLNLWVRGDLASLAKSMTLYQANTGIANELPLFISGEGTQQGASPLSGQMNLFIQMTPSDSIPLFLRGPGDVIYGPVNLFTTGTVGLSTSTRLVIPVVRGFATTTVSLYTSGF